MKKLLVGLTLLASMSSFASDCSISITGISSDEPSVTEVATKSLIKKGYVVSENAKFELDVFVYCFQGQETCASEAKLIDRSKEFNSVQDLRNMNEPLFGKASKKNALETSLSMVPRCK
ncbi:MAG: hypothetical protein KC478_05870 [Bacteriovoracaceae bacterium]|nr:hypothetical protein [Bacteriovoracaceae bacterium]